MPGGLGDLSESIAAGLEALSALHQGQEERAQALALTTMEVANRVRWGLVELRHALVCSLEVWLATGADGRHESRIRPALERLRRIARRFPSVVPNVHVYLGRYHFLHGRRNFALAAIRRSLAGAERLGSRYEVARAHYWLGRLAPAPEGGSHMTSALELFERLGCPWEAGEARVILTVPL
jgi:hypothetical protein